MGVLDLFFPVGVKCVFCGTETDKFGICDDCIKYLTFIQGITCETCGGERSTKSKVCFECKGRDFKFIRNYSIFEYKDEVRNKIIEFKQNGRKSIGDMFSYFIEDKYTQIARSHNIDLIVPVPLSTERLKQRKFNQSEVLCSRLIDTNKLTINVLERIKSTPHQTGLSRTNRTENLKDAFKVTDKKVVKGKTILVVDDIYTTGSTLNACAETLIKAGAKEVITMTLARAPIKKDKIIE